MGFARLMKKTDRLWNAFCDFTSIGGFRFMSTRIIAYIRFSAVVVFVACVGGLGAQLSYLVGQYLAAPLVTSSWKFRVDEMPLAIIYLCHVLNGSAGAPLPLMAECYDKLFGPNGTVAVASEFDVDVHRRLLPLVPYCVFEVATAGAFHCQLRCKWTSNGFCIEARISLDEPLDGDADGLAEEEEEEDEKVGTSAAASIKKEKMGGGFSAAGGGSNSTNSSIAAGAEEDKRQVNSSNSLNKRVNVTAVTNYNIQLFYNTTQPLATVYLRLHVDPLVDNGTVPLVSGPYMILERDSLSSIKVVELVKITRNFPPAMLMVPGKSFEFCIWEGYSELLDHWRCPSEYFVKLRPRPSDFVFNGTTSASNHTSSSSTSEADPKNVTTARTESDGINMTTTYSVSECAVQRAIEAQKRCLEERVYTRVLIESVIYRWRPDDLVSENDRSLTPNVRVFATETFQSPKSEPYKLMSEIGGSMALYLGFTLMSLVEALAFVASGRLRRQAVQVDEALLADRRNPPIRRHWKWPKVGGLLGIRRPKVAPQSTKQQQNVEAGSEKF